jgi:protein-tyrosine kinase
MSRVYEALNKAEKERKQKTARLRVSAGKPLRGEKIEEKEGKLKAPLTGIFKEEVVEGQINDLLVTLNDSLSPSADQFMKIGVRMVQQNGQPGKKTVLVTSAHPQEGKTMVASNVGIGLARLPDTNVTLIDADLRKPALHKMFGISVNKGLSEYLEGSADISEILYGTPVPRLFIIPGCEAHPHPERILSASKVQKLLKELQGKQPDGYVVIDSSPMFFTAEPEIFLNCVDSVIMVVRYGKTQRANLQRALGLLDKRKVMGIIFNQVDNVFFKKNDYYHSLKRERFANEPSHV